MNMETKSTPEQPGAHYETRDASTRGLVMFGIGLFTTLVVVAVLTSWLFGYFAKSQSLGSPDSPFENVRVLPPQPRLQVNPRQDLLRLRENENAELDSYGWVDQKNGIVHIPIARAMDLVAQRGLAARQPNAPPKK
jgi:hypothetical protein